MITPLSPPTSPTSVPTEPPRGGGGSPPPAGGGGQDTLHPVAEILGLKDFPCFESLLATATGLPPRKLAQVRRQMQQDTDWGLQSGEPAYAEKSVPALLELLGFRLSPSEVAVITQKSRRAKTPPIEARVSRFYTNPHLLQVRWKNGAGEKTADLIVTHRDRFKPGMVVPIRFNAHGRYELARRSPRAKGRW